MSKRKPLSQQRSRARRLVAQALYQWQMAGQDLNDIEKQFVASEESAGADLAYFHELLHRIPAQLTELDQHLAPLLDRPIVEVDPVERAILRLGAYELASCPEVPFRVVINEAVELAKTFGAEQGHRYVNAVLDRLASRLRPQELGAWRDKRAPIT